MNPSRLLSVLVENRPGVLNRVASMVRRRGFNIDSLSVGPTEDDSVSRMTIAVHVGRQQAEQATKQLSKLIDVITIDPANPAPHQRRWWCAARASWNGIVPCHMIGGKQHQPSRRGLDGAAHRLFQRRREIRLAELDQP